MKGPPDYWAWLNRHTRKEERVREIPDREEPAAPSEPIKVDSHRSSLTDTGIRKMRAAFSRYWHDRRG